MFLHSYQFAISKSRFNELLQLVSPKQNQLYLMKNYFFAAIAASALLFACKKNDKETTCEKTVAAIAGNYKVTKITLAGQDITNQYFSEACLKDDVYELKADKSVVYTDAGTVCASSSSGTGTWDVVSGRLTVTHSGDGDDFDGNVTNKCNGIEISESFGGQSLVFTLTKQ